MLRRLLFIAILGVATFSTARAQPGPVQSLTPGDSEPGIVEKQSVTWPLTIDVQALVGVEPHDRGAPVAFGTSAEFLWKARLGGFAGLMSSEGTPVIPPSKNGTAEAGFGDRISVPFGFALRPLIAFGLDRSSWAGRLAAGVDLQVGISIEHLRSSDDSVTTAGFHLGVGVDIPVWGGPKQGGVAVRLAARFLFEPSETLDGGMISEPAATTQLFAGLAYVP